MNIECDTFVLELNSKDDALRIAYLEVADKGLGHGQLIVELLTVWAYKRDFVKIQLAAVSDAEEFWESVGFEPTGDTTPAGIIMERNLTESVIETIGVQN